MNQVIAIFKKDARHLWPEILVSLVLTAAMVRMYPYVWTQNEYPAILLSRVALALLVLVPMSWWIVITRLVQSESLVGDRQFWLTRPYEWKKLLSAKALFLLAFLYIPLFIAHSLLIVEAGFHPRAYVPGLLYNLLLITGIIVLPLIALATVTGSFAKATLTLLGILVAIISMAAFSSVSSGPSANTPGEDSHLSFLLFVLLFLSVIILQYATRRLWLSRAILGGLALFGVLSAIASPDAFFVRLAYPQSHAGPPAVLLAYSSDLAPNVLFYGYSQMAKEVSIALPVQVSGIAAGKVVFPDNVLISIDAPNGLHWDSHWQAIYNQTLLPSTPATRIPIRVDRAFFNQVRSLPLSIHLTLAVSELQSRETIHMALAPGKFAVPGIGTCSLRQNAFRDPYPLDFHSLECLSPLRQPRVAFVQSSWTNPHCSDSDSQSPPPATTQGDAWIGSLSNEPADFSLAPIWTSPINLSNQSSYSGRPPYHLNVLCLGTPLTVTYYDLAGRTQTQITIPNLKFPPPTKAELGAGGFSN